MEGINGLIAKEHQSVHGVVRYWVPNTPAPGKPWLVFLPGLTADHRLFTAQISHFSPAANVFVWDPPAHNQSRPYTLAAFSVPGSAQELHQILTSERINHPIIIGQSFGGYVAQGYLQLYPRQVRGFISLDSAPLKRKYYSSRELWLLKHTTPMLRIYP